MKNTYVVKWPRTVTGSTMSTATAISCLRKGKSDGMTISGQSVDLQRPSEAEEREMTRDAIECLGEDQAAPCLADLCCRHETVLCRTLYWCALCMRSPMQAVMKGKAPAKAKAAAPKAKAVAPRTKTQATSLTKLRSRLAAAANAFAEVLPMTRAELLAMHGEVEAQLRILEFGAGGDPKQLDKGDELIVKAGRLLNALTGF